MNILFRRFRENRGATAAAGLILAIAVIGVLAPVLPLSSPTEISLTEKLLSPSLTHLLGTDSLGRDLLSRLIWGIRSTLFTGAAAMLITCLAGAAYGAVSVILGGRAESLMMRAADILYEFSVSRPCTRDRRNRRTRSRQYSFCLRRSEVALVRPDDADHPPLDHAVRICSVCPCGRCLSVPYSFLSPAPGAAGDFSILMTIDTGAVILMISSLSFLGLGTQPPTPEWGMMLSEAKNVLSLYPGRCSLRDSRF